MRQAVLSPEGTAASSQGRKPLEQTPCYRVARRDDSATLSPLRSWICVFALAQGLTPLANDYRRWAAEKQLNFPRDYTDNSDDTKHIATDGTQMKHG
jgi:hypothetical protein